MRSVPALPENEQDFGIEIESCIVPPYYRKRLGDSQEPMDDTGPRLFSRRRLLGLASAALLVGAGATGSRAAPKALRRTSSQPLRFDILMSDDVIGYHNVDFDGFGDELLAETRIEIEVKLLFLTLFQYSHRSAETWKADRLAAFASTTNDDGRLDSVVVRARENGFEVHGRKGTFLAPADIMVGSFWNPDILSHDLLIDPQKGTLKEQVIHDHERTTLSIGGEPRTVTRYRLSSILDGEVYYDDRGQWVGGSFEKKGTNIRYRLQA
jgi:hypothetical protein